MSIEIRAEKAVEIANEAGVFALGFFQRVGSLEIEDKGPQDFVSEADKAVETFVRAEISKHFPQDGIVGEEHAPLASQSGYTWVIDPIDGTKEFVNKKFNDERGFFQPDLNSEMLRELGFKSFFQKNISKKR